MTAENSFKALVILILLGIVAACGGGSSSRANPPGNPPPTGGSEGPEVGAVVEISSVNAGTCVDVIGPHSEVEYLRVADCNSPHPFEVAGKVVRPEGADEEFPGDRVLNFTAHQDCRGAFEE